MVNYEICRGFIILVTSKSMLTVTRRMMTEQIKMSM